MNCWKGLSTISTANELPAALPVGDSRCRACVMVTVKRPLHVLSNGISIFSDGVSDVCVGFRTGSFM